AMMEPAVERFREVLRGVALAPPKLPFISTVTGKPITAEQATSPDYWASHLRQPVRFADGVATLWENRDRILLEVGPRTTLTTLSKQQLAEPERQLAIASLDGTSGDAEWASLLRAAGQLWT